MKLGGACGLVGLPWWLSGKESACNAGDVGLIPGLGRSPGEGNGNPLQYSCLWNPVDRGAWQATVLGNLKRVRHDLPTKQQQQCDPGLLNKIPSLPIVLVVLQRDCETIVAVLLPQGKLGPLDENGGTGTWHLDLCWHYGATGLTNSVPLLNVFYYLKYQLPIFSASFESGVLLMYTWKRIHLLLSHTAMTCMLSHVQPFVTPMKKDEYRIWAWVPQSCINCLFNLNVHSLVPLSVAEYWIPWHFDGY